MRHKIQNRNKWLFSSKLNCPCRKAAVMFPQCHCMVFFFAGTLCYIFSRTPVGFYLMGIGYPYGSRRLICIYRFRHNSPRSQVLQWSRPFQIEIHTTFRWRKHDSHWKADILHHRDSSVRSEVNDLNHVSYMRLSVHTRTHHNEKPLFTVQWHHDARTLTILM